MFLAFLKKIRKSSQLQSIFNLGLRALSSENVILINKFKLVLDYSEKIIFLRIKNVYYQFK